MSSEISSSSQPIGVPARNKFVSLLQILHQLEQLLEQSSFRVDNTDLLNTIKREIHCFLQQVNNWDPGDDAGNPANWQVQLPTLLAPNSIDAVFKCLIVDSLKPSAVDQHHPRNVLTIYERQHRTYNQVFNRYLPPSLYEKYWEIAGNDYDNERCVTASDDWHVYSQRLRERQQRPSALIGIATGIPQLDDALGGLNGLSFLGGSTGVGKTCLAIATSIFNLCNDTQQCGVYYSLDLPKSVIYDRMVCQFAGVTYRELLSNSPTDELRIRIDTASEALQREVLPRLTVRHACQLQENQSFVSVLTDDIVKLRQRTGLRRFFIVVDSFRKIPVPIDSNPSEDPDIFRLRSVEYFSKNPILVVAEIRKSDGQRREVGLDDLLGSSSLGYAANNVLLLSPQQNEHSESGVTPVKIRIAKGRDGVQRRDILLNFDYEHYRFSGVEPPASSTRPPESNTSLDPLGEE